MKKSFITKIATLCVMLLVCVSVFCACNIQKYHATMYDKLDAYLNDEFCDEYGLVQACNELIQEFYDYRFVVNTEDELAEIFDEFPYDVDFDKQMVLVRIFTHTKGQDTFRLKSIKIKDNATFIQYTSKKYPPWIPSASAPLQRTIAVIMDKVDIAEFNCEWA